MGMSGGFTPISGINLQAEQMLQNARSKTGIAIAANIILRLIISPPP
jgi:hypothetical protein